MQETQVRSLGGEDPLEKAMATHFSILAWEISWMEEPGGLQSTGLQRVRRDWAISLFLFTSLPLGPPEKLQIFEKKNRLQHYTSFICTTLYFYFCMFYNMLKTTKTLVSLAHSTVDPTLPN